MSLSIKVKEVHPIAEMTLSVRFENGVTKKYDVSRLIPEFPIYENLRKFGMFGLARVDCGGCAVSWTDEIDISECELWENGE